VVTRLEEPSRPAKLTTARIAAQPRTYDAGATWEGSAMPVYTPQPVEEARATCAARAR
jgi:hypothetical protein